MKRSVSAKWGSLKVGILLSIAIVIGIWASLSGGGTSLLESKKSFTCYFPNVDGLISGSPVWMAGVEVGNVSHVTFVNLDDWRRVEVRCRVKESAWNMMTTDTYVQLGTIGFLGDKYVDVVPGTPGRPVIAPGSTVKSIAAKDASALFSSGEEAFNKAGGIASEMDTLLARVNRGEGTLGKIATDKELYRNLNDLSVNLTRLVADLQKNQERIVESLERSSNALKDVSDQVSSNSGTLGKIMNDPKLYDNLQATTARLDSIMTKIDRAEGSIGLLVNDTAMYSQFVNLMARTNNLITDIERNPHKYFKFSVF